MSFDYSDLAQTALDLITEYGKPAIIRIPTSGTVAQADYSVQVVETSKRQDGSLIPAGKRGYLIAASGAPEIKTIHKFYLGASIPEGVAPSSISEVSRIAPGNTVLLYEAIVNG